MTASTPHFADLVARALKEDVGPGDVTSLWIFDPGDRGQGTVVAKEPMVVAGIAVAREVFRQVGDAVHVAEPIADGAQVGRGDVVLQLEGPIAPILTGERTALNFLGRLSGVATLTRSFVEAVEGTGVQIVDTRKTTPGLRRLEKEAVLAGGGANHRMGLYDMVMVKDNHIARAGGIAAAVERIARRNDGADTPLPVTVEVVSLEQLEQLRGLPVDRVLLDNMSNDLMGEAVSRVEGWPERPLLEASGNMTLERVRSVAETGVDLISVGALTHSHRCMDLSLRVEAH